jgi:hypothetical protein
VKAVESGEEITTFTGESGISSCAFSPDAQTIIAADESSRVHFFRLVEADRTKSPIGDTKIVLLHRKEQAG